MRARQAQRPQLGTYLRINWLQPLSLHMELTTHAGRQLTLRWTDPVWQLMTSWTEGTFHWSAETTLGGIITSLQYLYSWRLRNLHNTASLLMKMENAESVEPVKTKMENWYQYEPHQLTWQWFSVQQWWEQNHLWVKMRMQQAIMLYLLQNRVVHLDLLNRVVIILCRLVLVMAVKFCWSMQHHKPI